MPRRISFAVVFFIHCRSLAAVSSSGFIAIIKSELVDASELIEIQFPWDLLTERLTAANTSNADSPEVSLAIRFIID